MRLGRESRPGYRTRPLPRLERRFAPFRSEYDPRRRRVKRKRRGVDAETAPVRVLT
jgi:hypothetical protein